MGVRSPLLKSYGDDFAWSLLDATPDATLIVAGTGEIVFVNDHAGELFGFELAELLGRVVDDLLPEALRAVHRAHRTRFRVEPAVRAMGVGLELWARRSDGSEFPVEISLSPLQLDDDVFVVAAVRDVTARVAADDQLHRVLRALDATDDAVFIFDAVTLRFSFVNDGAVRLVGYRRDELLMMTPLHLNPYTTESEYRRLVDELSTDGASSLVRRSILLAKDGSEVPVEESFHSSTSGRHGPSVITLARDITARLAAEAELRESQEALRQAEQVLAVADDRERIARDLHDTVIQRLFAEGLSLQAAMGGVGDPQRTRARLDSVVDGLDQTIKELRMAVFSLQGAAASAPGGLRGRLLQVVTEATDGLGFEPRLQFDGPIETIDVDIADHLIPVLREALSNIAHHAHAGHVRVAVSVTDDVTLTVSDDVTLTVSDDGVGVPADVFGGRGLTNMAERARALGGDFTIRPEPSGGSLLVWQVPVQRSPQPA
jgi:PAS domain S-box-containing protein